MKDITTTALEEVKRKKISYDILEQNLIMVDELAKIVSCTRAQILDSIIFPGTISQTDLMIKTWEKWVKDKNIEKKKKEKLKKLLKETKEFKKKWGFDQFPYALRESLKRSKKKQKISNPKT